MALTEILLRKIIQLIPTITYLNAATVPDLFHKTAEQNKTNSLITKNIRR
jgi:hypothetical protein